MELRQPGVPEHSAEESFSIISEAGYAGVCVDPSAEEIEEIRALKGSARIPRARLPVPKARALEAVDA